MTVREIIETKGRDLPRVSPNTPVYDVLEILEFEDAGALIVSRNGRHIDGMISERDIVRGLRYFGEEVLELKVSDLMTPDVITCELSDSIVSVMDKMHKHSIRHVPVVSAGKPAGLISIRDIVKDRLEQARLKEELVTP